MPITKRDGSDLARRSKKTKRTCNDGTDATKSLILGHMHQDSNQGFLSELSEESAPKLSKSVVSIAVSNGNTVLFACSGTAIERKMGLTRFLTSASLVRALTDRTKDHDNLKVEVSRGGNIAIGSLEYYDLDHDIAIVDVNTPLAVQPILFNGVLAMELVPCSKVVAVGRGISGKLMATNGILTCDSSGSEDSEDLMLSTCKISEALEGGPLFDIEGNFVGMNLFFVNGRTIFVPMSMILECLEDFWTSQRRSTFLARLKKLMKAKRCTAGADLSRRSKRDKRTDDLSRKLKKDRRTDLTKGSKKNKRTDLARSLKNNNRTDDLGRSLKKNKRTDNPQRSLKKNGRACNDGGNTAESFVSGNRYVLNNDRFRTLCA